MNLVRLIKWEYLIQNRVNNLSKYFFIFFLFCSISTVFVNSHADIKKFSIILSVIFIPIALLGFAQTIFRSDMDDKSLELLLTSFNETEIIIAKFLSILFSALSGTILNMPIIYIMFDLDAITLTYIIISLALLLVLASSLIVLIGTIQCYFNSNTNILAILIMPLLIPSIILTGLTLQDYENTQLIWIMIGIDMLLLPIIFYLSSYLVKNIYNI